MGERTEPRMIEAEISPPMTGMVHLWFQSEHALCGATSVGHPECEHGGRWPIAVEAYCPNCFRPLCESCMRIRSGAAGG